VSGAGDLEGVVEGLVGSAVGGDRRALARLLSIVERGGEAARTLSRVVFPASGGGYSVGITGAPGVGKSTLTARLLGLLRASGKESVAVLAIDPSSPLSGGAILGDRVRMQEHTLDPGVFVRSMASRGALGGLSRAVPEALRVLDATGWPLTIVETVGAGQVEVDVAGVCDTTVVVVDAGWGDAVQANKAGILEIADVLVVNKADRAGARSAARDLEQMLDLSAVSGWRPPVVSTVAESGEGVEKLLAAVEEHRGHLESSGERERARDGRLLAELQQLALARLVELVALLGSSDSGIGTRRALAARELDPYEAADRVLVDLAGVLP
jgi:LAO/AO transport system kinase